MPCMLDAFGLKELGEDTERFIGFLRLCVAKGYSVEGYRGVYCCFDYGDMSFIVRIKREKTEDNALEISGVDTHLIGDAFWHVRVIAREEGDPDDFACQCVVEAAEEDKGGIAVVHVLCADILPTCASGTLLDLQMCAFPLDIHYYDTEEDYVADPTSHLPLPQAIIEADAREGKKKPHFAILGEGTVCPLGLFANQDGEKADIGKDVVYLRGTVKKVRKGDLIDAKDAFYIVTVDTQFGPLDIVHTGEGMTEEARSRIHEGATVATLCILSGDAMVKRHESGLSRNEDSHLLLLSGIFANEDPERLRAIAAPDLRYISSYNKHTWEGLEAVLDRIRYVQESCNRYRGHLGTVVGVRQPPHQPRLPYGVGKRCVRLYAETADGEEDFGTLFVTLGDNGKLTAFDVTDSEPYDVVIDPPVDDTATPPHVWPAPPLPMSQVIPAELFAFARDHITACAKAAEAAGRALRGGLVWLKDEWEHPADYLPLVFSFNGETYAVDVCLFEFNRFPNFMPGISAVSSNDFIEQNNLARRYFIAHPGHDNEPKFVAGTSEDNPWALYGYTREDPPLPDAVPDTLPKPLSAWERDRLAILEAKRFLAESGLECLSVCGHPDVGPQIWFRDAKGRPCWLRTVFALTPKETDAKQYRGLEKEIPRFRANDGYCFIVHLPDFGTPLRGPLPTLVREPLQRLYVTP